MRLVLTRPEREASRWAQPLLELGHEVLCLPLIAVGPAPDAQALSQARALALGARALMFVSANAVRGFFEDAPPALGSSRAWVTGPGSAQALRELGVAESRIDQPLLEAGRFDSEALWTQVQAQVRPGDQVLIVRGADELGLPSGRPWLAEQLQHAGARVHEVASYARQTPRWSATQQAQAQAAAQGESVWVLSSSESLGHLQQLLPGQAWSSARAVATHERIAQAARQLGFGQVAVCPPTVGALHACLQSLQ
jgi:uroporphyrinogen-III synthase